MSTKLTLTIQGEIIERAKNYAKEQNRSLSDIIENYLKGSFKMPKNMDYKKELKERMEKKYL